MKARLLVGPAPGPERWLWPGLMSVLVHGALVAGVIGASGLVIPPRPDVVVSVALVFEVGRAQRPEIRVFAPKQEAAAAPTPASVAAASVDQAGAVPPASDAPAAPRADAPPPEDAPPQLRRSQTARPSTTAAPPPSGPTEPAAKPTAAPSPPPVPRPQPSTTPKPVFAATGSAAARKTVRPSTPPVPRRKPRFLAQPSPAPPVAKPVAKPVEPPAVHPVAALAAAAAAKLSAVEPPPRRPEASARALAGGGVAETPVVPSYGVDRLANPPPRYPYIARRRGLQGRVVLRVRVDPAGKPESVTVVRSSGHAVLDRSARNAVRRWRFTPAKLAGIPVAASVDVPVVFRLTE